MRMRRRGDGGEVLLLMRDGWNLHVTTVLCCRPNERRGNWKGEGGKQ